MIDKPLTFKESMIIRKRIESLEKDWTDILSRLTKIEQRMSTLSSIQDQQESSISQLKSLAEKMNIMQLELNELKLSNE